MAPVRGHERGVHAAAQFRRQHVRCDHFLGLGVPDHDLVALHGRFPPAGGIKHGRSTQVFVEVGLPGLRFEPRFARIVCRNHLHVVRAHDVAGSGTALPAFQHHVEGLDCADALVMLGDWILVQLILWHWWELGGGKSTVEQHRAADNHADRSTITSYFQLHKMHFSCSLVSFLDHRVPRSRRIPPASMQ